MCTRKWLAAVVLVLVGVPGFPGHADAVPVTYNFDGLAAGTIVRQSFPIPALGDNSQVKVNTATNSMIDRTVVTFAGSGAIAEMNFDIFVVPVEPATWGSIKAIAGR